MNTLQGQISNIEVNGSLALVTVIVKNVSFTAIIIETPKTASYLKIGNTITILFKETEVVITTGPPEHISLQNQILGTVKKLEKGTLLSKLIIDTEIGEIVSIITSNAVQKLSIEKGSEITAMIKTNEILLSQ